MMDTLPPTHPATDPTETAPATRPATLAPPALPAAPALRYVVREGDVFPMHWLIVDTVENRVEGRTRSRETAGYVCDAMNGGCK
jgi:hypothetical protein